MEIFGSEISNYGVVQYNPINGKVEGLVEKPEENLALLILLLLEDMY